MTDRQVLIIDDDNDVRKTIELSLQVTTDWKILTASSGQEGLTIAIANHPDAILLDVTMSDLDGIETLHQLQTNITTRAIPVIFLTARSMAKEQQKLKNLGVKGLISKPFDAVELGKQICSLLGWQSEPQLT